MGRNFNSELAQLAKTYDWATKTDLSRLCASVENSLHFPLIATGSGGSLTAATWLAELHTGSSGVTARALTPMAIANAERYDGVAVWLLSARGRNVDILNAAKHSICSEPRSLCALTMRGDSPLDRITTGYSFGESASVTWPFSKDGFLAVNSLLATCVMVSRAYTSVLEKTNVLPAELSEITLSIDKQKDALASVSNAANLVVLFDPKTQPAALDLESKLTEGALRTCQLADLRNFAHGRHSWIRSFPETTAVVALVNEDERRAATTTLGLLPRTIPSLQIVVPSDPTLAMIAGLLNVFKFIAALGKRSGTDPGRPRVADYQRKLYRLRIQRPLLSKASPLDRAVSRKLSATKTPDNPRIRSPWLAAAEQYYSRIKTASFRGVVLDYDGTICADRDRFTGLDKPIRILIKSLIEGGIAFGVATGRGRSVGEQLRKAIPKRNWSDVCIGYYNGGQVAWLNEVEAPNTSQESNAAIAHALTYFSANEELSRRGQLTARPHQITIEPKTGERLSALQSLATEIIERSSMPTELVVVTSAHSIDIIPRTSSKLSVVRTLAAANGLTADEILTIGDRGAWPGNDFWLLSHPYSLSCFEVSSDRLSCWNFAPLGCLGAHAAEYYLKSLRVSARGARLKLNL